MTDKEFRYLKAQTHLAIMKAEAFQREYQKQTGQRYVIGQPLKTEDETAE